MTATVRRWAAARPAVLLVPLPGGTPSRLAVERELRAAGWPLAEGPAAADLLVVAGRPVAGSTEWLDELYALLPGPRARVTVATPERAARELRAGRALLRAGGDRASHGGPVAGLSLAERGDDRDGLRLDVLRLSLGPALPDWPAGLVLRLALQGDVVVSAAVAPPPAGAGPLPFWNEPWLRAGTVDRAAAARRSCAAHLDSVARLLGVAGWPQLAHLARRSRDALLAGADPAAVRHGLRTLLRRGERSLTARSMLRGLGPLSAAEAAGVGVTCPVVAPGGDAYDRFRRRLAEIERTAGLLDAPGVLSPGDAVGPRGRVDGPRPPSAALLDVLPGLLVGAEFAAARLVVAGLDPDLDELSRTAVGSGHG
ncbi:hypothetical protein [Streptomyces millisiae]|uniref:Uncharacterized protein n=1 Tax=Streptomyces millisiae TaxID=3075542 RepID=A0ABU2LMM9_9ACTN|nr:hypothetical protein [Streptomyces sp. DSM 44918]MDT0318839.1 hypothetical protein [Streptomyces sp. DSM 44918]